MKGRNWSKETVRTITWLAAAAGLLVLAWALMWGIRQIRGADFGQQTQLSSGVEEIPLTMEDLTAQTYDNYTIESIDQESILLGRQIVAQLPESDDSTKPKLRYTLVDVKVSCLCDPCLEELLHGQKRKGYWKPIPTSPWSRLPGERKKPIKGMTPKAVRSIDICCVMTIYWRKLLWIGSQLRSKSKSSEIAWNR